MDLPCLYPKPYAMKKTLATLIVTTALLWSCTKEKSSMTDPATTGGTAPVTCVKMDTTKVTIGGVVYPVVKIGSQLWTAVNYKGSGGLDLTPSGQSGIYGKLYTWDQAMVISPPAGWWLPDPDDFKTLLYFLGTFQFSFNGGDLTGSEATAAGLSCATQDWTYKTGSNQTGFNAYPYGYAYAWRSTAIELTNKGADAIFWTSAGANAYFAPVVFEIYQRKIDNNPITTGAVINTKFTKRSDYHMAIRFVANY
jgi:uncharacterized protein (TIGR02145 family)